MIQSAFKWAAGESTRLSLMPIRHHDLWKNRKIIEGLRWTAAEVDLTRDRADWDHRLNADQRHFVATQLAFFSRIDIDVLENIGESIMADVDCIEARLYFAGQMDGECVHAESYALQIEAVMDGETRDKYLNAVRHMPVVADLRDWALRWFDRKAHDIGERLVAFAAVEGIMFRASFCALQYMRDQNLLPGITTANDFIVRDEELHADNTCTLVRKYLRDRPTQARAEEIIGGLMGNIDRLVDESLPVRLIGMNAEMMKLHVRHRADFILGRMGYAPMYRAEDPFIFSDKEALNDVAKTNFFERTVSQYQNVTAAGANALRLDTTPVE